MLHAQMGGDLEVQLPLSTLNELTRHVATISKKKAPQLAVQKRGFVKNYYADLMQIHNTSGGGGGGGGGGPISAEAVYREVDQRLTQALRSVTGTGDLSQGHVDGLAEKISTLLGQKVPVQKGDRRKLIMQWHAHIKQQMRA
jgi:hypothetical protein